MSMCGDDDWVCCPGGVATEVLAGACVARCPACNHWFATVMDEPVFPPHYYLAPYGEVVVFVPQRASVA